MVEVLNYGIGWGKEINKDFPSRYMWKHTVSQQSGLRGKSARS